MPTDLYRRRLLQFAALSSVALLPSCGSEEPGPRYTDADIARLAQQRLQEGAASGHGPFGPLRFKGYRGLAELPWFEIDAHGELRIVDLDLPKAIDMHGHLGMSLLLAPEVDLHRRTVRVMHLLDCDATDPGCELDLDVYINRNFSDEALDELWWSSASQGLWGSASAATQTIPNLLHEMDNCHVERAAILPIAFDLPFGDDLTERWIDAIELAGAGRRLIPGCSVHPQDPARFTRLRDYAAAGARIIKFHPTMQRAYPDSEVMMELYAECERLGLIVFFHCGRAGIEPEPTHRYALPRHYEPALETFPNLQFVLGHSGARDVAEAVPLALRYQNAWLDTHGQGVTTLHTMLARTGGERMLFGTDWPFYHLAASLAKLLLITEKQPDKRFALLRGNAQRLLNLT
ncbi:MAG: amidohydrolase family protein [Halioglobus sp.]|nr:amidohydrolase family protein [Halioglobus sp.]